MHYNELEQVLCENGLNLSEKPKSAFSASGPIRRANGTRKWQRKGQKRVPGLFQFAGRILGSPGELA